MINCIKLAGKDAGAPRGSWHVSLGVLAALFLPVLNSGAAFAIPAAEKLLPDDTLVMVTVPDFGKLREIYGKLPQSQLWNDAAMKPFKDKFLAKWKEEFVKPLERELQVRFDDYQGLLEGQLTFALVQNATAGKDEEPVGWLVLLDTQTKGRQLKNNLAELRKKWVDAGRTMRTEKIRGLDFSVLSLSSNDVPKTLRKLFPQTPAAQESGVEGESKKASSRDELVIGQVDSVLLAGSSTKVVEKVAIHLTGGAMPALGELAAYEANHLALFREAPVYGWMNMKALVEMLTRKSPEKKEPDAPDPLPTIKADQLLAATGLAGVKTLAFNVQSSNEGLFFRLFLGVPEASRRGLLKLLAGEPKEHSPPPFVPADAVEFQRWRLDGQKAWAAFDEMITQLRPQTHGTIAFILDTANANTKLKDPSFDIRRDLIGNLGDDMISYEKAPRGNSPAERDFPPSLFLLGSPNAEVLASSLKSIFAVTSQEGGTPAEREFLGRKILSVPKPNLPLGLGEDPKPGPPRTLSYAASRGYVAMSTDPAMLEEYLRSAESQAKTLRETPGLAEAAQKVTGPGTGLFGYKNQTEAMRVEFEALKQDSGAVTNAIGLNPVVGSLGVSTPQMNLKGWMDFSLLPAYDKIAKYFHFTVYGVSASVDGLTFKWFAPTPPALKGDQGAITAR
jgi:hypothetical protein